MGGIGFDDSAAASVVLAALALFFVVVNGFFLHRHLTWAPRVRRLLEQEGFAVRSMERRWLTKGPFERLVRPGTREWLIRLVAVGSDHLPRAGWVRWRRARPWEAADQWAVRWDEAPWSGQSEGDPGKRGLSSRVFFPLVLVPALVGAVAGVSLLVRAIEEQQESGTSATTGQSGASGTGSVAPGEPDVYEIRCRGGGDSYRVDQLSAGPRIEGGVEVSRVLLSLEFAASPSAAGTDTGGLSPGTCGWLDRPLNAAEPRVIRFETPALVTPGQPGNLRPLPGTFPADEDLRDARRYWSFFVFNTNQGYLQAARHGPWDLAEKKGGSS